MNRSTHSNTSEINDQIEVRQTESCQDAMTGLLEPQSVSSAYAAFSLQADIANQSERKLPPVSDFLDKSAVTQHPFHLIGRELHDGLAQTLWSVCLQSNLLEKNMQQHGAISPEALHQLQHIAALALSEVRGLIDLLDAPDLRGDPLLVDFSSYLGYDSELTCSDSFPLALSEYMHALNPGNLHFDFDWSTYVKQPHRQEARLFRIAQSAISNAVRHACARHIHVQLSMVGNTVCLRVQDDGQGMAATLKHGYGLRIMEERVAELEGTITISSSENRGTTVEVLIPKSNIF